MLGHLRADDIERVLHEEVIGRIGCRDGEDCYVVPVTYAYDGHAIYGHSREGRKLRAMTAHPRVCFEVDRWRDLSNWESVIAWGRFERLEGAAATEAMERLVARVRPLLTHGAAHAPHPTPPPAHAGATHHVDACAFRIVLEERTGRFEHTVTPSTPHVS
ncbi:MAG: pyridoxamine 5'-phosphate oxidase family protein [Gemmatimonadaceae bacterium]|jgi:hypothetical protein|nr:pyridoxamine 5'-phosphate oxidase family protein [Gemmatimonadaceae bacterium]